MTPPRDLGNVPAQRDRVSNRKIGAGHAVTGLGLSGSLTLAPSARRAVVKSYSKLPECQSPVFNTAPRQLGRWGVSPGFRFVGGLLTGQNKVTGWKGAE